MKRMILKIAVREGLVLSFRRNGAVYGPPKMSLDTEYYLHARDPQFINTADDALINTLYEFMDDELIEKIKRLYL